MILLLAACAWGPARVLGDSEHADVFAIEAHGRVLAGTALVSVRGGDVTLHAVAPTGTDLFEVRVGEAGAAIDSPDAELGAWLERMPFHRDLTALYRATCEAERCRFEGFRIVARTVTADPIGNGSDNQSWRIRGPGGPATYAFDGERWRLDDPRRGYVLTVVPGTP